MAGLRRLGMKRLIAVLILAASIFAGYSQTPTNTPAPPTNWISSPVWTFLVQSNLMYAGYGIWNKDSGKYGAGVALAYKLSPAVVPTIRLDYIDGRIWQPQAELQLQAPILIGGKFWITPLIYAGMAVPLTGKGGNNYEVVGIAGSGLAIGLPKGTAWYVPKNIVASVEIWSGAGYANATQVRAGLVWK